ncbi:MAG: efflux RND transporter permease subunit [Gammaproteobacteria bacterium]|nr:efflux RND transporter permease subunit [Gammaproteobacteria bacterium]MBQ0838608.1 efflux RND transporter permease subunit [Gammaproteobacteria bacterium]
MFAKLLQNHTLTNLTFLLILVLGWMSYQQLPREQDPSINFNWVQIWTYWPGATAPDIEARITGPLEDGIKKVQDIRFVSSTSREGVSSILVRFEDMNDVEFDKRMTSLRREIQARQDVLPPTVSQPDIFEISSSKTFPTASLVVFGASGEEVLQSTAHNVKEDLQQLDGVDDVISFGDREAELQVDFLSNRLVGLGISSVDLADTVRAYFRDLAAGDVTLGDQKWLIRLSGTSSDPAYLGKFPIASQQGEVLLRNIAELKKGRADPQELVRYQEQDGVLLLLFKKSKANNLQLLEDVNSYIQTENQRLGRTGVRIALLDDQTEATRQALNVMERNALIGLIFVMLSTWVFLGFKIAFFTSISIPFVLAGVFCVLAMTGETLNITVLLGVVISLGMLVDDAVVVVEGIDYHMQRGMDGISAVKTTIKEVAAPVVSAVLTTIAAFLPLMLLPGVLGDFMRVVPLVVSIALVISLVKAFWILPSHVLEFQSASTQKSRVDALRKSTIKRFRNYYTKALLKVMRAQKLTYACLALLSSAAILVVVLGWVRVDFFATDFFRLFYVNIEMPAGTSLEKTSETLGKVEALIHSQLSDDELRGIVNYAGQQSTDQGAFKGAERGQVFVSLVPAQMGGRSVDDIIESLRPELAAIPGPKNISFLRRRTGPPTAKAVSIKVRGDDIEEIRRAVAALQDILALTPGVGDIVDDDTTGGMELRLQLNPDTITRVGLDPTSVARTVHLHGDGEIVASMQHRGEKLDVRVRAKPTQLQDIDDFLNNTIGLEDGGSVPLGELLLHEERVTVSNIRRYNFRRAVTVEASLDPTLTDTLTANKLIREGWQQIGTQYPGVSLDFSGELDDIRESLGAMVVLFVLGLGLVYLILGTQFKSYSQPLIVLAAIPMAFIGVVFGLFFSANPISLFTLYGTVALAGIAANDAIVLMSTANRSLDHGCTTPLAIVRAARRRFVPILITSITTMLGLFSLATGLGGESLTWGPVATAIVWGLGFSTLLTLFVVPLTFLIFVPARAKQVLIPLPGEATGKLLTISNQLKGKLGLALRSEDTALSDMLAKEDYRARYEAGITALRGDDTGYAIKCFEYLADEEPDVPIFNLMAAQALVRYMQVFEWDIGYAARFSRYINRVKALAPDEPRLSTLLRAMAEVDAKEKELHKPLL